MTKSNTAQRATHGDVLDCPLSQASVPGLSFLHLPAEIRNKIYRYSLIKSSKSRIQELVQPPLTRTNQQVRAEALPVYYGNNRFEIIIPAKPLMHEKNIDGWSDFIRMFRVFKAGRSAGPGTGSLQFLRYLACRQSLYGLGESFWNLEVIFMPPVTKLGKGKHPGCGSWDHRVVQKPKKPHLLKNRESAYKCVLRSLRDDETIMHETCVHRLIDTIVMVATECPDIIKEIHFHSDVNWDEERFPGFGSD